MKPKFSELLKGTNVKIFKTRAKDSIEEREAIRKSDRIIRKQEFKAKKGNK